MDLHLNDSIRVKLKKPKKLDKTGEPQLEYEKKSFDKEISREHRKQEIDIKGNMTLNDVVEKYDYPLSKLKEKLDLPDSVDGSERLGPLRKEYGFRLGDVKEIVLEER